MRAMIMGTEKYEGLEVVAWINCAGLNDLKKGGSIARFVVASYSGGAKIALCRLSDAQRAIAELREECSFLKDCQENAMLHMTGLVAERDTLRQQLAERDAEIERLRVKLMTIASAEPRRHNIEWAKAMAATGNNEAYAKWRAAFDQRDNLAGLLAKTQEELDPHRHAVLWGEICAALAEVKPCQESPNPAAT